MAFEFPQITLFFIMSKKIRWKQKKRLENFQLKSFVRVENCDSKTIQVVLKSGRVLVTHYMTGFIK